MVLFDRIKFDGLRNRDWIIFKYPVEDIKLGSTLVVNEGQLALFVKGGQIYDVFDAGTHILSTNNLPLIGNVVNFFYNNQTPFTAEIYFINLTNKLDLYWGTTDPIQLIDPKYFVKLRIRAFGQVGLRIEDSMLFFRETIGSLNPNEIVQYEKVLDYFKGHLITYIKTALANKILTDKISALEISTQLMTLSTAIKTELEQEFEKFGFNLVNFHIQSINFPDEDFNKINEILSERARFEIMGENRYHTQRTYDTYEAAASNPTGIAGAFLAGGVGVGLGMNAMQTSTIEANTIQCTNCKTSVDENSKFCSSCGTPVSSPVVCKNCNTSNPFNARFCSNCSTQINEITCSCGQKLPADAKFCFSCGDKI